MTSKKRMTFYAGGLAECAMSLNKKRDTRYDTSPQKHNTHTLKINGGVRIDKQQISNRF